MELEELIVEIVIGLFLLFTSYQIGIKENIATVYKGNMIKNLIMDCRSYT